jgi:excinuclease ABC subunit C
MKNDPAVKNFDGTQAGLYPHLKITNETYPRILATRKIDNDSDEYFGAFLTKTATRILIDFLNKTFRIRSCDIPIDGKFSVPCTQYYHRRCLAPCVESLCTKDNHNAMVELVRSFLANRRSELIASLHFRIQLAADALDFETAAYWRDILAACEEYWKNPRWNVWLDNDVVDTFAVDDDSPDLRIYLITQRKRHVLGRKAFSFTYPATLDEAMSEIAENFYCYYAPREIRVTHDFAERRKIAKRLSERFGRVVPINVITNSTRRATTIRAARLARDEIELDAAKPDASARAIASELKGLFRLSGAPKRVECFDVAHISGRGFVAAWSTWIDGHLVGREYGFRISYETSELSTLSDAVLFRAGQPDKPDLIILDGGQPQMSAVLEKLPLRRRRSYSLVAAAKPPGKHSGIAYLLLESGERIEFDETSPAQNVIKILRDDAHDLANRVHRDLRDSSHNYELASILPSLNEGQRREALKHAGSIARLSALSDEQAQNMFPPQLAQKMIRDLKKFRLGDAREVIPLIVPIRFGAENGSADDLRPINSAQRQAKA